MKPLREKTTKFTNSLFDEPSKVRSFMGSVNGEKHRPYVSVELENTWFTPAQIRRLIRTLEEHLERVEGHQGVGIMSGSSIPKKKPRRYRGYTSKELYRFVSEVEKLADRLFDKRIFFWKYKMHPRKRSQIYFNLGLYRKEETPTDD